MWYSGEIMITKRDLLKERITSILHMTLDDNVRLYETSTGDTNWNLVRDDMMNTIDAIFDHGLVD